MQENGRNNYMAKLIDFLLVSHYTKHTHTHIYQVHFVLFSPSKPNKKLPTKSSYTPKLDKLHEIFSMFYAFVCNSQYPKTLNIYSFFPHLRKETGRMKHDNTFFSLWENPLILFIVMQSNKKRDKRVEEVATNCYVESIVFKKKEKYRRHSIVYNMTYWLLN